MDRRLTNKRGLATLLVVIGLAGVGLLVTERLGPAGAAPPPTPTYPPYVYWPTFYPPPPTPGGPPTPTPVRPAVLPTPLPSTAPQTLPPFMDPRYLTPAPTPAPNDPRHLTYIEEPEPGIIPRMTADYPLIIAIGTVLEVQPPRWATADGRKPDFSKGGGRGGRDSPNTIITPVVFQVEEYLKGPQPARTLVLRVWGGTVDGDVYEGVGPVQALKQKGRRFVVYLQPSQADPTKWWLPTRAAVLHPDGTFVVPGSSQKQPERLDDLRAAIRAQATPTPQR
ncbi:MAG: hypothetical protein HY331_02675 [Chloroflexi bacterium]|nr:hypothetical protein [Chloroflexota bacterium]